MIKLNKRNLTMNRIRHIILSIALLLGSFAPVAISAGTAYAQASNDAICAGINTEAGGAPGCDGDTAGNQVTGVIRAAIQIFQAIIGIISLFVLSLAGLNYITSGGDSSKTKTAKDRILYATIGLVIVGLAQVIVSFVLRRVDETAAPAGPPSLP